HRMRQVADGQRAVRKEILYSIIAVDNWTPEDRAGLALRVEGWPASLEFLMDVELWDLELGPDRLRMIQAFERWCADVGASIRDKVVNSPVAIIYRLAVSRETGDLLLHHRDVRRLDLPPRYQLDFGLVRVNLEELPGPQPPPLDAPGIAVLDSGVATGHPLLAPAIGDAQSFIPGVGTADEVGHGTMVAGLALYGDVQNSISRREFVARARLRLPADAKLAVLHFRARPIIDAVFGSA
ncbi:MAG: hypothetical protein M0Z42_17240, partial [Actinomycetota bacterium]|nr:hypothetical protein [Actinomycetota bacterium]